MRRRRMPWLHGGLVPSALADGDRSGQDSERKQWPVAREERQREDGNLERNERRPRPLVQYQERSSLSR